MVIAVICVTAVCMMANAVRLRRRLTGLRPLEPADEESPGYVLITAEGVTVPAEVRRAATTHAARHGLGLLDLVPADLPADQALDLLRHLDPRAYRDDVHGMGRGAGHALLVTRTALTSARPRAEPPPSAGSAGPRAESAPPYPEVVGGLDAGEMGELTARLRFYAGRADMVAAGISGIPRMGERRAFLRSLALVIPESLALPQTLGAAGAGYALMVVLTVISWPYGVGLAALYCVLPYVVFGRTAVRPCDLRAVAWGRLWHTPWSIWRTLRAPRTRWERARIERREAARRWYGEQIAAGLERFREPRRADCPWCGGTSLRRHVVCRDLLQGKPGRFRLDRCRRCGHVFQNPRLTPEGLGFYYKDVYDGLGDLLAERTLSATTPWYRARARMAARHAAPRSWLDVGTGRAHFCRVAADILPGTRFDGLDQSPAVHEGRARGWITRAHHGTLLDHAADLTGAYDLVSMFHYLEHTPDPAAELDAAVKLLPPGGHLLIEVPDPESPFARLLRGLWVPYLAPQHLHLIPIGNLRTALELRGLRVIAEERRAARQGPDVATAAAGLLNHLSLDADRPWWPRPPGRREYTRVFATLLLAAPLMTAAILLDLATWPLARRHANAYRLLARKDTA